MTPRDERDQTVNVTAMTAPRRHRANFLVAGALLLAACPPPAATSQGTTTVAASTPSTSSGDQSAATAPEAAGASTAPEAAPAPTPAAAPESPPPVAAAPAPAPARVATAAYGSDRPQMNSSARDRYQAGLAAAQRNDLQGALSAFEAALSADPRAYLAAYNAGIIAERLDQQPQADGFYQRALSIVPDYELAIAARARLLVRSRRNGDAVLLAEGAAHRAPQNYALRAEYAQLLVDAQRYDDAIAEGRQILRADERNVAAKLAIAEAYRAQGHADLAIYIVDDVINGPDPEHPNNGPGTNDPHAHYLRGLLRIQVNNDVQGAITSFTRATELDPQFAEAHNNLGVYLLQSGDYPAATEHLRAAVQLSPSWAKAHLNLGDVLRATGSFDPALAEFQRAQTLDPAMVDVHYDYARLYSDRARASHATSSADLTAKLQLLQQSQTSFQHFRDALGASYAAHPRHDDVEQQLARLAQQIERTTVARDRAGARERRGSAAPAPAAAATPAPAPAADPAAAPASEPAAAPAP